MNSAKASKGVLKWTCYGLALVASCALGYGLHPDSSVAPVEKEVERRAVSSVPDKGESAALAALRQRIRDLEAQLAEQPKAEMPAQASSNALARAEHRRPEFGPPGRLGREQLEELKKSDPERFAQMTNRFAKMQQDRKNQRLARATFLSSVDTSHMSAKDRETHEAYQELLAKREELESQMHQSDLTDEARDALMNQMRELDHQMRTLGEAEQSVLLNEVASSIGMEGEAATELVETVKDVIEATESKGGGPGGPGGGPDGGPGGGSPPSGGQP